jgi:hypothetical protein
MDLSIAGRLCSFVGIVNRKVLPLRQAQGQDDIFGKMERKREQAARVGRLFWFW